MALPVGVTSATITFGVPTTFTGAFVRSTVSIQPSATLVHTATGTPLINFIEDVITTEGTSGQFVLPHTDQTGFQDEAGNTYQNWYYTATVTYASDKGSLPARIKTFQLTSGQTVVDLDLLPAGAPVLPYTAQTATVTSFAGRTGAVTVQDSDLPARLAEEALNATYATRGTMPAWASKVGTWDDRLSLYNANPANLNKWRKALNRASGGLGSAHITTHIDSITFGATSQAPVSQKSWPGRLRRMLDAAYGPAGTGIVVPWAYYGDTGSHAVEPRFTFAAAGVDSPAGYGIFGKGMKRAQGGAAITFGPATCNEYLIYLAAPQDSIATVDSGTGMVLATNPYVTLDTSVPNVVVAKFDAPPEGGVLASHTLTINGYTTFIYGVEARIKNQGVRVSNLAFNGESTISGAVVGSMIIAFDMPKADLAVMLLSMNDFQSHTTVAGFKDRTRTMIQRQRAAGGDVLLVTAPQPDFTQIPADQVQTPAMSAYFTALYELANEEDAPLLDLAHRWESYTANQPYYFDSLHPNDLGAEDIARAVYNAVTGV